MAYGMQRFAVGDVCEWSVWQEHGYRNPFIILKIEEETFTIVYKIRYLISKTIEVEYGLQGARRL